MILLVVHNHEWLQSVDAHECFRNWKCVWRSYKCSKSSVRTTYHRGQFSQCSWCDHTSSLRWCNFLWRLWGSLTCPRLAYELKNGLRTGPFSYDCLEKAAINAPEIVAPAFLRDIVTKRLHDWPTNTEVNSRTIITGHFWSLYARYRPTNVESRTASVPTPECE